MGSVVSYQWREHHNEDMYPHIISKISWPIWIHAHNNVIACQLFSHVMGDFHLGIWIFLVFSWMIVPGDSDVPNKSQDLGSLAGCLGGNG